MLKRKIGGIWAVALAICAWFARGTVESWFFDKVVQTIEPPTWSWTVEYGPPLLFAALATWLLTTRKPVQRPALEPEPEKREFVSLSDAARRLYETARRDGDILADVAERMSGSKDGHITIGSPNDILNFLANHISRHIAIYGKKSPSTLFERIRDQDVRGARFTDGATVLRDTMYDQSIFWTDLAVRTVDFETRSQDIKIFATPQPQLGDDFQTGFNRALFTNRPTRENAILRLTQLRGEGVVIRNDAAKVSTTTHLDDWVRRVRDWMREVIETLKFINAPDSEYFATLDAVPPARIQVRILLTGDADARMFGSTYNQHDLRLVRLTELLKKYGVG